MAMDPFACAATTAIQALDAPPPLPRCSTVVCGSSLVWVVAGSLCSRRTTGAILMQPTFTSTRPSATQEQRCSSEGFACAGKHDRRGRREVSRLEWVPALHHCLGRASSQAPPTTPPLVIGSWLCLTRVFRLRFCRDLSVPFLLAVSLSLSLFISWLVSPLKCYD